jgi:hypothetical protein
VNGPKADDFEGVERCMIFRPLTQHSDDEGGDE